MSESREVVIRSAVDQPLVIPVNEIVAELVEAAAFADQAEDQATRAVINDTDSFNRGADLQKIIRKNAAALDEKRKDRKRPIDAAAKRISDLYDSVKKRLDKSFETIQSKNTQWALAEEKRRREAAEAETKRIEAEALAAASATVAIGGGEAVVDADHIIDAALQHIKNTESATSVKGKGSYGATSGVRRIDTGVVTDPRAFLRAFLNRIQVPGDVSLTDIIEFKQSGLNKLAATGCDLAGFKIETTEKVVAR